jgi:hypothetical protein
MRKLTKDEFIERAVKKYGNKFDYSEVVYLGDKTPVKIICPFHGEFAQTPGCHLTCKYGCNLCSPTGGAKLTQQQFVNKCVSFHGNKFDYSKVIFTGVKKKVIIVCPIHGDFEQIAEKHFMYGCSACAGNKPLTVDLFIERSQKIHDGKYDYSLVMEINGVNSKVLIGCPKHGLFEQNVNNHLIGKGCLHCGIGNSSKKERQWLDLCGVPNDRLHRNVLITISGRKFCVDGLFRDQKIIYEFLGNYWHGHPIKFDPEQINEVNKKKFSELFDDTVERIRLFRKHGYKVICIWETNFDKRING